jgi:hypothetical protein
MDRGGAGSTLLGSPDRVAHLGQERPQRFLSLVRADARPGRERAHERAAAGRSNDLEQLHLPTSECSLRIEII